MKCAYNGKAPEPRGILELARLGLTGQINIRRYFLADQDADDFEERCERPGERASIRELRGNDCRDNLLPRITEEMLHSLLDPRREPGPANAYGNDWYLAADIAAAACICLDLRHPQLFEIEEYWKPIAAKIGRLLKQIPFVEIKAYDRTKYLYRYTDNDLQRERVETAQQEKDAETAMHDRGVGLHIDAQRLGVRVQPQPGYGHFVIDADALATLLALAAKGAE